MQTKVITGKVRFSYANVFVPTSVSENDEKKYNCSILIPKSDKATIDKIKKAIAAALEAGVTKFGGKIPKNYKNPLRDGDIDREDDEAYADHYFINASSKRQPGVVDSSLDPILDSSEFYSGCYGRASINFYAFNSSGNKGIAAGLNNLQKLQDGERLGAAAASAEEDFGEGFEDDDLM